MNNALVAQERSRPRKLVLLLIAASIVELVLYCFSYFLLYGIIQRQSLAVSLTIGGAIDFPLFVPCIVWLASRSGGTSRSTWVVPLLLLFLVSSTSWFMYFGASFFWGYGASVGNLLWSEWERWIKPSLIAYVILTFLFRTSTLHLRPMESQSSLHRLSVRTIMLLTAIVAVCLSLDAMVYRNFLPNNTIFVFSRLSYVLLSATSVALIAMLWFSCAWLFVTPNPKKWMGFLGLTAFLVTQGIINLVCYPMLMNQNPSPPGSRVMLFDSSYYLCQFGVRIFHAGLVFLCVGAMHWAGYRWDLYRPSQANESEAEKQIAVEPSTTIVSRIEI